jgi:hypothetical protein
MTTFVSDEMPYKIAASQGQVSHEVEGLMAYALVFHAKFVLEWTFGAKHE